MMCHCSLVQSWKTSVKVVKDVVKKRTRPAKCGVFFGSVTSVCVLSCCSFILFYFLQISVSSRYVSILLHYCIKPFTSVVVCFFVHDYVQVRHALWR